MFVVSHYASNLRCLLVNRLGNPTLIPQDEALALFHELQRQAKLGSHFESQVAAASLRVEELEDSIAQLQVLGGCSLTWERGCHTGTLLKYTTHPAPILPCAA